MCKYLHLQASYDFYLKIFMQQKYWFFVCCFFVFQVWVCERAATLVHIPAGSPLPGGNVVVYVLDFDINQPSLPTPFYSALVSVSVFMALSTVFHSINSPNNSPLSHSVLLVFFFCIGPFNCVSPCESLPQPGYNLLWLTGLRAPAN